MGITTGGIGNLAGPSKTTPVRAPSLSQDQRATITKTFNSLVRSYNSHGHYFTTRKGMCSSTSTVRSPLRNLTLDAEAPDFLGVLTSALKRLITAFNDHGHTFSDAGTGASTSGLNERASLVPDLGGLTDTEQLHHKITGELDRLSTIISEHHHKICLGGMGDSTNRAGWGFDFHSPSY